MQGGHHRGGSSTQRTIRIWATGGFSLFNREIPPQIQSGSLPAAERRSVAVNIAPPFTTSSVERTYTSSSGNFPVVTVTARGTTRCQIRNAVPETTSAATPISAHRRWSGFGRVGSSVCAEAMLKAYAHRSHLFPEPYAQVNLAACGSILPCRRGASNCAAASTHPNRSPLRRQGGVMRCRFPPALPFQMLGYQLKCSCRTECLITWPWVRAAATHRKSSAGMSGA
jgi:hypothetical protein